MRIPPFRGLLGGLIQAALLAALAAPVAATPIVVLDAQPHTPGIQSLVEVELGDTFVLDVVVSDLPDPGLVGFDLTLGFEPDRLAAVAVDGGDFLADPIFTLLETISPARFAAISLGPLGATGHGVLASFTLTATAVGSALLHLADLSLTAPFGVPFVGPERGAAEILVSAAARVPLPAPAGLLCVGLCLLAWIRRGRRAPGLPRIGSPRTGR